MNITGTILKDLRKNKNLTLDELAEELNEKFNITITGSMLSKWETGKASPVYDHLKRLALYYEVTTDFLLGFDQYKNLTTDNLDITKNKNHNPRKRNGIKEINKLLDDDEITTRDILFLKDIILLMKSNKHTKLYK